MNGETHYIRYFQDQRVPADVILLRTTERAGSCFIRTDQLDGETDWKLRLAVGTTQKLAVSIGGDRIREGEEHG